MVRAEVVHIYTALTTEAAGPGYDFTTIHANNIAEIQRLLSTQPTNTTGSPYTVVLGGGFDLEKDFIKDDDPLGLLYEALDGKYVNLDLSACGGGLPGITLDTVNNRPNKDRIVSLTLPDTLTSIGEYAFFGCTSLAAVDLPDSLASIGDNAFSGCTSLAAVDLPDSLTEIGDNAFRICTSLAAIDLPDSLTSIGRDAFSYCTSLAAIDLPDNLTSIGEYAFYYCMSLASIGLPDALTEIGGSAFESCTSLASIDLPDSLTFIEEYAFYGCTSLAAVTSRNTTPPGLGANVFYNTSSSLLIYVPDASVDVYQGGESAWSVSYASQIKPLSQLP
jgi:hypothetical protein